MEVKENQWFTSKVSKLALSIGVLERSLSVPATGRTPVKPPRTGQIDGILEPVTNH